MGQLFGLLRKYRLLLIAGYFLVAAGLIFNVPVLELLVSTDGSIEWPDTLLVYSFQLALALLGILLLIADRRLDSIETVCLAMDYKTRCLCLLACLLVINLLLLLVFFLTSDSSIYAVGALHRLFHLDAELNVPSTYSALQLLLASVAALLCSRARVAPGVSAYQARVAWLAATGILFYMGLDEFFSFHENTGHLLQEYNVLSLATLSRLTQFGYGWTVIAGSLVVLIGLPLSLAFFRIFRNCRQLFGLLVLAGVIFVLGAIAMENLQVYLSKHQVGVDPVYVLMLEEFFEMVGISITVFVFIRFYGEMEVTQAHEAPSTEPAMQPEERELKRSDSN